jgi:hypothetical protein
VSRRAVEDVPATSHFDFLYGTFGLSKWKIAYFATTVTMREAANDLHLTAEIPGAEGIQWHIDELYQRNIDWPRVEGGIVPYLRNPEVPQFFNSVTIALLPFDSETGELVPEFGENHSWAPPELFNPDRFKKISNVGPIAFGHWESWKSPDDQEFRSGQLRWNTRQVFGVAIDGQHRLAAIKMVTEGAPSGRFDTTRVPVIFLLFDERVGFSAPDRYETVSLLRALFIDLNKHAKTVNRARQILLDDRDPHAIAVRCVVGNQLTEHLDELTESPPRLPLSLVDWHTEQAKFDAGPYITTILGLDWLVSRVLDTRPIGDYTDYSAIKRQIGRLQERLGIDLGPAFGRVEELENVKMSPFVYSDEDLELIGASFAQVWGRPLCRLLTEFLPYGTLKNKRLHDNSLSLEFQRWYELFERMRDDPYEGKATQEYRQYLGRLAARPDHPVSEAALKAALSGSEALKLGNLAFNVVFQRALVDALLEYVKIGPAAVDELAYLEEEEEYPDFGDEDLAEEELEEVEALGDMGELAGEETLAAPETRVDQLANQYGLRADEFVRAMNRFAERVPDVLDINFAFKGSDGADRFFWLGTLRKAEGGIDFTQGASNRAKDLLFIVAAMCLFDDRTEPSADSDFDEFWDLCVEGDGPAVCRAVGRAIKRFAKNEASAAGRILKSRDEDFDENSARDEAYYRMAQVWQALEL